MLNLFRQPPMVPGISLSSVPHVVVVDPVNDTEGAIPFPLTSTTSVATRMFYGHPLSVFTISHYSLTIDLSLNPLCNLNSYPKSRKSPSCLHDILTTRRTEYSIRISLTRHNIVVCSCKPNPQLTDESQHNLRCPSRYNTPHLFPYG